MAKPLRGAPHRLHPARVSESCPCPRRTAPAPYPGSLLRVLPRGAHSPVARQGCAPRPANCAAGTRQGYPDSRSRWPPPSLHPTGGLTQPNPCTTLGTLGSGRSPPTLGPLSFADGLRGRGPKRLAVLSPPPIEGPRGLPCPAARARAVSTRVG